MKLSGPPWSAEEVSFLKDQMQKSMDEGWLVIKEIAAKFKQKGFNRTPGAISRKIIRLSQTFTKQVVENKPISKPKKKSNINWVSGALELNKSKPTKFVMLNDVHVPHNIKLDTVWEFVQNYKPDYMLLVGDIVNNDPFDHWAKARPRSFKAMPQPKPYFEQCNEIFYRPMREAVGSECTVVHWIGNHEHWSSKAIADMPEGEGYWEVYNNIEEVDAWVASREIANLGHLHFLHGDIINGGKYHAEKMMTYFRRNIRYGHYHDIQEYSHTSPIDIKDRHTARCCGTLEKFNPKFMDNRPHNWQHAFTYGVVAPNGNFWDHTTIIIDGQFWANGKIYG